MIEGECEPNQRQKAKREEVEEEQCETVGWLAGRAIRLDARLGMA